MSAQAGAAGPELAGGPLHRSRPPRSALLYQGRSSLLYSTDSNLHARTRSTISRPYERASSAVDARGTADRAPLSLRAISASAQKRRARGASLSLRGCCTLPSDDLARHPRGRTDVCRGASTCGRGRCTPRTDRSEPTAPGSICSCCRRRQAHRPCSAGGPRRPEPRCVYLAEGRRPSTAVMVGPTSWSEALASDLTRALRVWAMAIWPRRSS